MPSRRLVLSCLLASACLPGVAAAQIKRCNGADGKSIFTDRSCVDVGGTDSVPHAAAGSPPAGGKPYAQGCSRSVRDLIFELTASIDSRDTNRLAGLYNWPGMSSNSGYAVLGRLDAIANRPLVDIRPILPAPQLSVEADGRTTLRGDVDASQYPTARVQRATPVGLRIEQTVGQGGTPARTVFGLRRYMGCWWLIL